MYKIIGGKVWNSCPLTEIATVKTFMEAVKKLWWLEEMDAMTVIIVSLVEDKPVLAGYASEELSPEPPDNAKQIGVSRYGHPVFAVNDEVYEPYYIKVDRIEEE